MLLPTNLYLRSVIYEVLLSLDDARSNQANNKQVNHPVMVNEIEIDRRPKVSAMDLLRPYVKAHTNPDEYPHGTPYRSFVAFPVTDEMMDKEMTYTVITGNMQVVEPITKERPLIVSCLTDAEVNAKVIATLEGPKLSWVDFILLMPESAEYMWDLTLTHAPKGAVHEFSMEKKYAIDPDPIPGLGHSGPTLLESDMEMVAQITKLVDTQFNAYVETLDSAEGITDAFEQYLEDNDLKIHPEIDDVEAEEVHWAAFIKKEYGDGFTADEDAIAKSVMLTPEKLKHFYSRIWEYSKQ